MKILSSTNNNFATIASFKAATVNINAFSDTHGELFLSNKALEEMRLRQGDIFCKENTDGGANVVLVGGDWFMDGGKKGYATNPYKENARFQLEFFNAFVGYIRDIASNTQVLFTPGNHEFDGGVPLLDDILKGIDAEVLMSNLDIESSAGFSKTISENKIINEKVIEVEDDKNPDLKHKILFLGVSPVNLSVYQKDLQGISLLDNVSKLQRYVTRDDYEKTIEDCKRRIDNFKQENPLGRVILVAHTGVEFADNIARESKLDLIFDGHEHKDTIRVVNGTPIVPLSQNFKKIVNAKIKFDDSGNLDSTALKVFSPLEIKRNGPLLKLYYELFKQDVRKKYTIYTDDKSIKELDVKNVRQENSFLANFITDAVLEELRKEDDSIDFFALNSSSIRHSLEVYDKPSISFFDVMNVLSGIKEEDGQIMTTELTGSNIIYMILDNIFFNKDMPQQNPLIHYSGLIIDRTSILNVWDENIETDALAKFIIDEKTGKPIEPNKIYKIANVEKYFNKSQNKNIRNLKSNSEYVGQTVQELFKKHFESSDGKLYARCDVRIY